MDPSPHAEKYWRRKRIERARAMSGGEKITLGIEMFEAECRVSRDILRGIYPGISEDEILKLMRRALDRMEAAEDELPPGEWLPPR